MRSAVDDKTSRFSRSAASRGVRAGIQEHWFWRLCRSPSIKAEKETHAWAMGCGRMVGEPLTADGMDILQERNRGRETPVGEDRAAFFAESDAAVIALDRERVVAPCRNLRFSAPDFVRPIPSCSRA